MRKMLWLRSIQHYQYKCPVRDRGGPTESPGQRNTKACIANVAPKKSEPQPPADNDIGDALKRVMATMHFRYLLDTGSPVTIVSLVFLLKVWAKKHTSEQSPESR